MPDAFKHPNLIAAWHATVRRDSRAAALLEETRSWTRAELDTASDAIAAQLPVSREIKGRRVALAEPNGAPWLAVFLALLKRGAVPVLLDASESQAHAIEAALHLGATALWTHSTWTRLSTGGRAHRKERGLVKTTSGSSGQARGFLFSDRQMLADGHQICAGMNIGVGDVNLGAIPFGHSYGLGNLVIPLLAQGTAIACVETPLPGCIARICIRHSATVFPAVPVILKALVNSLEEPASFSCLRLVISAGSPIRPEDAVAFRRRFGLGVHVFYGSSETGGIAFDGSGTAAETGRSVGKALPGVAIRMKRGERIEVRSPAVMGNGRHSPADRVRVGDQGELALIGRVGRMVKLGGRRVDLAGVEAEIQRLPGVRGVTVDLHPGRADSLAALIATDRSPADLRQSLHQGLADWKVPARIRVVPTLPLSTRGKIDRLQARRLLSD